MGMLIVLFSMAVVIIQATSMLLDRPAHKWTFWMLHAHSNITNLQALLVEPPPPPFFYSDLLNNFTYYMHDNNASAAKYNNESRQRFQAYLAGAPEEIRSQAACIQGAWQHLIKPSEIIHYCTFNRHLSHTISPFMEPLNPHLILLTLCCIHSIFCISRTHINYQERARQKDTSTPHKKMLISLEYITGIYVVLISIVAVLQGLKDVNLVKYPTILIVAMLLGFCILYVVRFPYRSQDIIWGVSTHLQLVAVPLAVLAISTMGVRLWTDVLGHIELLNAAVYCMWLQCNVKSIASQRICHLLVFFLPLLSLYLAHIQWGQYDDWRYVIGTMACGGLAPFLLITLLFHITSSAPEEDKKSTEKLFNKVSIMCSGAAILTLVINLAIF